MADDPELKPTSEVHSLSVGERWLEENRAAIAAYNERVAEHGLLSDDIGLLTERERWLDENRAAIESINAFIDQHGLAATKLRVRSTD